MKLIHYSSELIKSLEPRCYDQNQQWQAKPRGLWFSVENDDVDYNWKEWCESEKFRLECLEFSYEIKLKENSNVLHLKTPKQIFAFTKLFPIKTRDLDTKWDTYQLDWNKIKEKHQGIIISPYQFKCRLSLESSWYYGWDCSSGCIWDLNCIEEFTKR